MENADAKSYRWIAVVINDSTIIDWRVETYYGLLCAEKRQYVFDKHYHQTNNNNIVSTGSCNIC